VVTLLGLFMMGLRGSLVAARVRLHVNLGGGRPIAAYIIGIFFAFGWTRALGQCSARF